MSQRSMGSVSQRAVGVIVLQRSVRVIVSEVSGGHSVTQVNVES